MSKIFKSLSILYMDRLKISGLNLGAAWSTLHGD